MKKQQETPEKNTNLSQSVLQKLQKEAFRAWLSLLFLFPLWGLGSFGAFAQNNALRFDGGNQW